MDLFELQATLRLNTSAYDESLSDAEREGQGFIDRLANKWTNAKSKFQTVTTVLKPVIDLVSNAVELYSEYEQAVGGVRTLFGDAADDIIARAKGAWRTAGLSMNDYMSVVQSTAAKLLSDLGGDAQKAGEIADMAITDMADNVNAFGTDMSSVMNAYQGFSRGVFSMLDNLKLGYGGTQEEMHRLLEDAAELDEEFASTAVFSMDSSGHLNARYSDIVKAIHIIQQHMGVGGTTQREGETTLAGSWASVKALWENLQTVLADQNATEDERAEMTSAFSESLGKFLHNLMPVITTVLKSLITAITEVVPDLLREIVPLIPQIAGFLVDLLTDEALFNSIISMVLQAVVMGLAGLLDVLVTTLISIFKPGYGEGGSAFTKWGVYDWIAEAFGFNMDPSRRYNRKITIDSPRGAVETEGELVAGETPAEAPDTGDREKVLSGLMELYGFGTARGSGDQSYLDAWRSTFESGDDDAMERNMKLLGLTDEAIEGMHQTDAQHLSAMMSNVLALENMGDMEGVAKQMHQLQQAVALLNQGYFGGSVRTNGDLILTAEENFLSDEEYATIVARIRAVDTEIDNATRARSVQIGFDLGDYESGETPAPHAKGLWDVPYDNYLANLHRDEMVLTASQARDYREGNGGGLDTDALYAAVSAAVAEAVSNIQINMDGTLVGNAVAETVSRNIYREAARRY